MLDGRTDKESEKAEEEENRVWRIKERFHSSPGNRPLFEVKREGLKIVDELMNYKFSSLLRNFFQDFKKIRNEVIKPETSMKSANSK